MEGSVGCWVCGHKGNWLSKYRLQEMLWLGSAINIIGGSKACNLAYIYAGYIIHIKLYISVEHIDLIEIGTGRST